MSEQPLWRRSPLAVFPVCLGFLGLGLGWRGAGAALGLASWPGEVLLGLAAVYYLFFLLIYLCKVAARPGVLWEDLQQAPARAGLAALAMSMMMLAAALLPWTAAAPLVWWLGVGLQGAATMLVCAAIWREPAQERHFSPFQYLTFVGPLVAPIAGVPMGYARECLWLTLASLVAFGVITAGCGLRLRRVRPPAGLRPSLVIFLAANCLLALSFGVLGFDLLFAGFYGGIWAVALIFARLVPWLINGGWSPAWAAFAFPAASFLNVQVMAVTKDFGAVALVGVYVALVVATPLVLWTAYRFARVWATGALAEMTGAARA